MEKYCYVASARRRARRMGAHVGGEGRGILCRHAHSLLLTKHTSNESSLFDIVSMSYFVAASCLSHAWLFVHRLSVDLPKSVAMNESPSVPPYFIAYLIAVLPLPTFPGYK